MNEEKTQIMEQPKTQIAMANYNTVAGLEILNQRFEIIEKEAERLSKCSYLPDTLRGKQSDCAMLMELAIASNIPAFLLAQEMYVVYGRFAFSSKFIIAQIQKRFPDLDWEYFGEVGDSGEIERKKKLDAKGNILTDTKGNPIYETGKIIREGRACVAYATRNGKRIVGPRVSMALAKAEGWFDKNGSKWQTMPEIMLRYRAACFFKNFYCPDVMMGIKSVEEERDVFEADFEIQDENGDWKKPTPFSRARRERKEKLEPQKQEAVEGETKDVSTDTEKSEISNPAPDAGKEISPSVEKPKKPLAKLREMLAEEGATEIQCKNYCRRNGILAGGKVDEFAAQKIINAWDTVVEFIKQMPLTEES